MKLRDIFKKRPVPDRSTTAPTEAPNVAVPTRAKDFQIQNEGAYSPHLNLIHREDAFALIRANAAAGKSLIDIGGRNGERRALADGYAYSILDIDPGEHVLVGDICHCPQILSDTYDVVFSMNLLEHVVDPWAAAAEMVRIARPGGLLVHLAPFAWRYHPFPEDHWRFSHSGLKLLFERTGHVETILSGYDIGSRRKDQRGGALPNHLDVPPVDQLGGWREHWHAVWVGRKALR